MITAPKPTQGTRTARRTPFNRTQAQPQAATHRLSPVRRRRQRPLIALGVLLVVGGALASVTAWANLGNRQAVLAVTQPVAAGQVITSNDLTVIHVAVDSGVVPVAAANEWSVVGRPAAVPLVPNSLLAQSQVGSPSTLSANQAIVGVALKDGQFPPGLTSGAHVMVVQTPGTQLGSQNAPNLSTFPAVVVSVSQPQATSATTTVVSLRVDSGIAPQIASAAATGNVTLVEVANTP